MNSQKISISTPLLKSIVVLHCSLFSEKGKKVIEYDGDRSANAITKWCLKKAI
jgi:hypothetical protein